MDLYRGIHWESRWSPLHWAQFESRRAKACVQNDRGGYAS